MAKQEHTRDNDSGGIIGMIGAAISGAASVVGKAWDAVMADGMLKAAGRQGIDELGTALKAFPDSLQAQENGAIWNPTQSEIAADRELGRPMWPSEIAAANRHQSVQDHNNGHDHGQEQAKDASYSM